MAGFPPDSPGRDEQNPGAQDQALMQPNIQWLRKLVGQAAKEPERLESSVMKTERQVAKSLLIPHVSVSRGNLSRTRKANDNI